MSKKYPRQRILIVDDESTNIKILAEVLKSDYHISFSLNGDDALEILKKEELPDLILLDIIMPGMNGYEVCDKLKSDKRTLNIPVIFITAMSEVQDEKKGLEVGAVDYITKPFSRAIVKARVRTHLELKRHRDILEHLSSYDGLTGIPNRRRFDEFIELEWRLSIREAWPLSLILIDIDHFKLFNDNYGHGEGDDCLRKVASTLADSVKRPSDMVARYGGEEFATVLPKTDKNGAVFIAEAMRTNIVKLNIPHYYSETANYLTISLGAATIIPSISSSSSSLASLISSCDKMLYKAKHMGRNQVQSLLIH